MRISAESLNEFAISKGGAWNNYNSFKGSSVASNSGICFEWKLKPVIKVGIGSTTLVGKLLDNLKIDASLDIVKWLDIPSLKGHYDIGDGVSIIDQIASLQSSGWQKAGDIGKTLLGIDASCSLTYQPWDEAVEEIETELETNVTEEIETTDQIILSTYYVELNIGESQSITITGLPDGLKPGDVQGKVEDESIATFDQKTGSITALAPGSTKLLISAEYGKNTYSGECAINVIDDTAVEYEGIK